MEWMEIIGYLGALVMGVTLGLFGAGGSILTVPVLYYLFRVDAVLSTAYSLFIVGVTALAGAVPNMLRGTVSYRTVLLFATPSLIAVYLSRAFLVPAIPDVLFTAGSWMVTRDIALLSFFAIVMIIAAVSMIRSGKKAEPQLHTIPSRNIWLIFIEGFVVGLVTGLVGAGGGFLIIPALVILGKLPMKLAVGTSLLIIAIKSTIGFLGDIQSGQDIDWRFLLIFTSVTILGILLGTWLSRIFDGRKLKGAFGWFVLVMGVYIIISELFLQ